MRRSMPARADIRSLRQANLVNAGCIVILTTRLPSTERRGADMFLSLLQFLSLIKNVCINQVHHPSLGTLRSSVVSVRSRGWNQFLTGQESNSFTRPSLRGLSF